MHTDLPPPTLDGESTPRLSPFATVDSAPTKETPVEDLLSLPAIEIGKNSKDITGQRFGRLVALRPVIRTRGCTIKWLCACDCGGLTTITTAWLLAKKGTRSCGCLWAEKCHRPYRELSGRRFGRLIALRRTDIVGYGGFKWECICDCGKDCLADGASLVDGSKKSCGCLQIESGTEKLRQIHASGMIRGPKHYHWNPALTDEEREHKRPDAYLTSKIVFWRDNYTCLCCGRRCCCLNAHHMRPWGKDRSARYDPDNLVTLCVDCHKAFHHECKFKDADEHSFVAWFRQKKLSFKKDVDTPDALS